jgi:hypothetical protein
MPDDQPTGLDFSRWEQPDPTGKPRRLLEDWFWYQRHEFHRKLRDLTPAQLASFSIPPVELSVLGLVRHMTQMEHVYLTWGLGGGERVMVYGENDYAGGSPDTVESDLHAYLEEMQRADAVVVAVPSLETEGSGHGMPLRATLVKMIDEYALHAGQAHMLRFAALGRLLR